jgi:hypothetical protein
MSNHRYLTKDQELARKAQRAFREQERAQLAERGIADEAQRRKDLADRTKRLRELRLARDAAEQASAKARPAAQAGASASLNDPCPVPSGASADQHDGGD